MNIVIAGPKGAGKSSVGRILSGLLDIPHLETDDIIEQEYEKQSGKMLICREIHRAHGETEFRALEARAVEKAAQERFTILSTGGSALLNPENRRLLRHSGMMVYLKGDPGLLWSRVIQDGIPAYLKSDNPRDEFSARVRMIDEIVLPYADTVIETGPDETPEHIAQRVKDRVEEEMYLSSARFSTLGHILQVHTFGESHGPALGVVIDGLPPKIAVSEESIQHELDRRRPGQSSVTTSRSEADRVRVLSGVFEGQTTGAPLAMVIENRHHRSKDYEAFRDIFRPGHADFTYWKKYGIRDYRGGGRSSGRETAGRVMGGAVAKQVLAQRGVEIRAFSLEIAGVRADTIDYDVIEKNPVRSPDSRAAVEMEKAIINAKEQDDSVGGIIQVQITGVEAGLGDPVFAKLDARLGGAFFSIGAVKGVEIGEGFNAARLRGSANNDQMKDGGFLTNRAGGITGGISTGETIIARVAVKPTPSIGLPQQTFDTSGKNRDLSIEGRHDPCIVPRAVPVVEAMAALVILDCLLIQDHLREKQK